jgi:hypothetical protein
MPSHYSSWGFCSLKLFPLGQQHRFTVRVVDSVPLNYFLWASSAVLLFEWWIMFPRIISFGLAVPFYYSSYGLCSLELVPLGQQRRLIIRVVDSGPSNHFLFG